MDRIARRGSRRGSAANASASSRMDKNEVGQFRLGQLRTGWSQFSGRKSYVESFVWRVSLARRRNASRQMVRSLLAGLKPISSLLVDWPIDGTRMIDASRWGSSIEPDAVRIAGL